MMKFVNITLAVLLSTGFLACQQSDLKKDDLKTMKLKQSYSMGLYYGKNMKSQMVEYNDVDTHAFLQGLKDAIEKDSLFLLTDAEIKVVFDSLGRQLNNRQMTKQVKIENEFLAKNGKEPGVITTPSGLQYKVLTSGNGPSPKLTDQVKANYIGTLLNGKEFDNSYKRGEPATFPVNGVIPGWTEALQLMKVGDKWRLFVPFRLGYGPNGAGGQIPPYATLIFDVELLSVEKAKDEKAGK
jgi:FKBP-type peptidyl-prolyl cis-trans isomerase FklB